MTKVGPVSRQVHTIFAHITPEGIDLALLVATARVPYLRRPVVAVLNGTPFAPQIEIALRPLFSELHAIAMDVQPVVPDVAQVAGDVVGGCG